MEGHTTTMIEPQFNSTPKPSPRTESPTSEFIVVIRPVAVVAFIVVTVIIICRLWRRGSNRCLEFTQALFCHRPRRCCRHVTCQERYSTCGGCLCYCPVREDAGNGRSRHICTGVINRTDIIADLEFNSELDIDIWDLASEISGDGERAMEPPSYDSLRRRGEIDIPVDIDTDGVVPYAPPPAVTEAPPSYEDAVRALNQTETDV